MNSLRLSGSEVLETCSVEARVERFLMPRGDLLRGQRPTGHSTHRLDLLDSPADELGLDRLGVDLLHHPRRLLDGSLGDLLKPFVRVFVPAPDSLEVEDCQPTQVPDHTCSFWTDHTVHRRGE